MKLSFLFIAVLFCGAAFGQVNLPTRGYIISINRGPAVQYADFPMKGDTLFITDPSSVHFIKLGDKVYQITVPKPFIEEVKPPEQPTNIFGWPYQLRPVSLLFTPASTWMGTHYLTTHETTIYPQSVTELF